MSENNSQMGRHKKLESKRVHVHVYFAEETLEEMNDFVYERKKTQRDYSRSDFVNDAVTAFLQSENKDAKKTNAKNPKKV